MIGGNSTALSRTFARIAPPLDVTVVYPMERLDPGEQKPHLIDG